MKQLCKAQNKKPQTKINGQIDYDIGFDVLTIVPAYKNEDYDQTQTETDPMDPSVTTTSTTYGWGYEKGDDKFHAGIVNLTLDINSTWKVTGDSYVAGLTVVGMKGITADSEVMVFFNKRRVSVKAK